MLPARGCGQRGTGGQQGRYARDGAGVTMLGGGQVAARSDLRGQWHWERTTPGKGGMEVAHRGPHPAGGILSVIWFLSAAAWGVWCVTVGTS